MLKMITITNPTNFKLISPFVNTDAAPKLIEEEVKLTSSLHQISSAGAEYAFKFNLFPYAVYCNFLSGSETPHGNTHVIVSKAIRTTLIEHLKFISEGESDSPRVSTSKTARFIRKLFKLAVFKDNRKIYAYNFKAGFWEEATLILERFIYELIVTTLKLKWSQHFQDKVVKEVDKKLPLLTIDDINTKGFAFSNATLNYSINQFTDHKPEYYCTMHSDVKYDPKADCPVFKTMLDMWFKDDLKAQDFVQEWFGYCLSGSHKANVFLIIYGSGGEGKSTFISVLDKLIGNLNVSSAPLSNLNSDFGLEPLVGKKINIATENSNKGFETSKLKSITAGEPVTVNRKNIAETSMILQTKLVYLVNELPQLNDTTDGLSRRLLILPFKNRLPKNQQDINLIQKLESELSGILNWAIAGLHRLAGNGYKFTISSSMEAIQNRYLSQGDIITLFCKEALSTSDTTVIQATAFIDEFREWAAKNDYSTIHITSPKIFWTAFSNSAAKVGINYKKYKSNGKQVIKGLQIIK